MNQQVQGAVEKRKEFPWTPEADARLKALFGSGTYIEIAQILAIEFGVHAPTRKAMGQRANKIGLKKRDQRCWPKEHDEELKALFADPAHYSQSIIAEKMNAKFGSGYTRNAIIGRLNRMGFLRSGMPKVRKAWASTKRIAPTETPRVRRRIKRQPESLTQMQCAAIEPRHLSLTDLEKNDCRWPYGDGPFSFCGHPRFQGSYCAAHFFLSIGPGTPSERAADSVSRRHLEGAR